VLNVIKNLENALVHVFGKVNGERTNLAVIESATTSSWHPLMLF